MKEKEEILLVPLEAIPENMSVEEFIEAWHKADTEVLRVIETKCEKILIDNEHQCNNEG